MKLTGPDISNLQGDVDWRAVRREGHDFAIVKAGEGGDWEDPYFTRGRWRAMGDAGLIRATYHFLRPRPGRSGAAEGEFFVARARSVGWGKGDLPLCLDAEVTRLDAAGTRRYVQQAVDYIRHETGRRPIVYSYPAFAAQFFGAENWGCHLWIASYGVSRPQLPRGWCDYLIWQYTSNGSSAGHHPVDLNVSQVDLREYVVGVAHPPKAATRGSDSEWKPGPPAYPGTPLHLGSTGSGVERWQAQMRRRGWAIAVDGVYGPASERVCRAFQQEKQLTADGIVGPRTWEAAWEAPVTAPKRPPKGSVAAAHPELEPEIAALVQTVVGEFPDLRITSTTGGAHAAHSLHPQGRACDLAVLYSEHPVSYANAYMDRAARWIDRHLGAQLTEGIHRDGLSVRDGKHVPASFWGPETWAAHANHIHLAK